MTIDEKMRATGVTNADLACDLGVASCTVASWRKGLRNPPSYALNLLLERIDAVKVNKLSEVPLSAYLQTYTATRKVPVKKMAETIGVSVKTVYRWKNGTTKPSRFCEKLIIKKLEEI